MTMGIELWCSHKDKRGRYCMKRADFVKDNKDSLCAEHYNAAKTLDFFNKKFEKLKT